MLQLNPPLPLETPRGSAICHFLLTAGIENHLYFVCFLDDTGQCWTFDNRQIRAPKNITWGRLNPEKPDEQGQAKAVGNTGWDLPVLSEV